MTDFDVRVRIQGGDDRVTALEVQIIDQDAHPYAAIGGPDQALGQDPAGGVRFPDEVLQIQGLFRQLGHRNPRGKRPAPIGEDRKSRLARMTGGRLLEVGPNRGARVIREGRRRRAGVIFRHAGAAGEEHGRQHQQHACSNKHGSAHGCPIEQRGCGRIKLAIKRIISCVYRFHSGWDLKRLTLPNEVGERHNPPEHAAVISYQCPPLRYFSSSALNQSALFTAGFEPHLTR